MTQVARLPHLQRRSQCVQRLDSLPHIRLYIRAHLRRCPPDTQKAGAGNRQG